MYEIIRNGHTNTEIGILVRERPSIPSAEYNYTEVKIPGRDGSIFKEDGTVSDITITVPFTFAENPQRWQERFRTARRWLMRKDDTELILSDELEYFYHVKHTKINAAERQVKEVGEFDVEFTCEGYRYRIDGKAEYTPEEVFYNPYDRSRPVYLITGEGECILQVNGSQMKANVGQNLVIDTDRLMAYRKDGKLMNTSVYGDYAELHLLPGENTVYISRGFDLKVIPNWRCL